MRPPRQLPSRHETSPGTPGVRHRKNAEKVSHYPKIQSRTEKKNEMSVAGYRSRSKLPLPLLWGVLMYQEVIERMSRSIVCPWFVRQPTAEGSVFCFFKGAGAVGGGEVGVKKK